MRIASRSAAALTRRRRRARWLALLALAWCLSPGTALAYDEAVHAYLSRRVYRGATTLTDSPATAQAAVELMRQRLWRAGAESRELKARFLARYPTLESFDFAAMKRFFSLNPAKHVAGFDDTPLPDGQPVDVFAKASRLVDEDERNRDRLQLGADGKPLLDAYGQALPTDPATLEMGARVGLSSQAHAHYQLPRLNFSDDPDVLKGEPRRFATPPTTHTFGADFAESYSALAILAAHLPGGQRLALTYAGAVAHHVEDIANQIHTVQVGFYDFFFAAKLESWKEELLSVGGLLGPRHGFIPIGIQIITNHHSLVEALFAKHLLTPNDPVSVAADDRHFDPPFAVELAPLSRLCSAPFGRDLVYILADRSSLEGPAVYSAIYAVADPRLRTSFVLPDDADPDRYIRAGANLEEFFGLELRGIERADMALAAWWERYNACTKLSAHNERAIAESLVAQRLDALDAEEARAKAYVPKPPVRLAVDWRIPAGYLGVPFVAWLVIRGRKRRAERKRQA